MRRLTRKGGNLNTNTTRRLKNGRNRWGNMLYREEWTALSSADKKKRVNSLEKKLKCNEVLDELIHYKNKKGNATITLRDALRGCETSRCKFWHEGQGNQKKGQLECRFSKLKRKAMDILKEKCPEYLRGGHNDHCLALFDYIMSISDISKETKINLLQNVTNELGIIYEFDTQPDINRVVEYIESIHIEEIKRRLMFFFEILKSENLVITCYDDMLKKTTELDRGRERFSSPPADPLGRA